MSSLGHVMGDDLTLDAKSGIAVVSGSQETRENILRRLCTNPGAYIWQLDYGTGLPAMIGEPLLVQKTRRAVLAQMMDEFGVDQTQAVNVELSSSAGDIVQCTISYVDAQTGRTEILTVSN
ncbi:hypothetical protein [Kozakia baliensis]|uniref:hypothetical protein n=1 Tax=Kozakia baliensis TaxID=153496 RepID=UPI0004961D46|nr:hypothetical protein [Kozakia baliensis]